MERKIIKLLKNFIEIPSESKNREMCRNALLLAQKELDGYTSIPFISNGISSLISTNRDPGNKKFKIILNVHLDVVPAKPEQYKPVEKDGKIYGRGAYDMKAAAAAMIIVFKELGSQLNYPLGLQIVTDEELGGENGSLYQLQQGIRCNFVLGGENSSLKINNEARGSLDIEIMTRGDSVHAGYPWDGENPVAKMHEVLTRIYKLFPQPENKTWQTTVGIIKIDCPNEALNSTPEFCRMLLSIRNIPEDHRNFIQIIRDSVPFEIEINVHRDFSCEYTAESNPYVLHLKNNITEVTGKSAEMLKTYGGSDLRYYHDLKIPGVNFSPIGGGLHSSYEWVDIESLKDYYLILRNFLLSAQSL